MDGLGFRADAVVSMQATSPGLRGADLDAAVAKLEESGADSVATVLKVEHEHPYDPHLLGLQVLYLPIALLGGDARCAIRAKRRSDPQAGTGPAPASGLLRRPD